MFKYSEKTLDRFFQKVNKTDTCWLWTGCIRKQSGYGQFRLDGRQGKKISPSRFMYFLHNGEFNSTLNVCHTCDNPICVNPEHLFVGTQSDNMKDCVAKGRHKNNFK